MFDYISDDMFPALSVEGFTFTQYRLSAGGKYYYGLVVTPVDEDADWFELYSALGEPYDASGGVLFSNQWYISG